jgi:PIN domain nuclease of toxin-antitoxin system
VRVLLDTHVWLWSLVAPDRLAKKIGRLLEAAKTERWISAISAWEVLVLAERGRIRLSMPAPRWIDQVLDELPFHEAPLSRRIAVRSRSIQLTNDDPADRFLVATALEHDLTFITADEKILESRACRLLAAR